MLGKRDHPGRSVAIRRLKLLTRRRFTLGPDSPVMVAELKCGLPGCPPLETVIAFWTSPVNRHAFKVFKPLEAVTPDDFPPRWMKSALFSDDGFDCC